MTTETTETQEVPTVQPEPSQGSGTRPSPKSGGPRSPEVEDAPGRGSQFFTIFLSVACLALAVEVVLLVRKNRELAKEIARANAVLQPKTVEIGDTFDDMTLVSELGEEGDLTFGEGQPRTLMLVFTLACPACERTFPVWSDIIPAEDTPKMRVIALRLDKDEEPVEASTNVLPFPLYSVTDADSMVRKISRVPTTVLLDEFGVVEKVWPGSFTPEKEQDFRDTLASLTQPGT